MAPSVFIIIIIIFFFFFFKNDDTTAKETQNITEVKLFSILN